VLVDGAVCLAGGLSLEVAGGTDEAARAAPLKHIVAPLRHTAAKALNAAPRQPRSGFVFLITFDRNLAHNPRPQIPPPKKTGETAYLIVPEKGKIR
jgi:hypothetical protein